MSYKDKKIILTDGDGVLLDWEYAFGIWMQERGYILREDAKLTYYIHEMYNNLGYDESKKLVRIFNESAAMGFVPALRDAMHYVKRLHEEYGYVFHCITSMSKDVNAQKLRSMNLNKLFGATVFEELVCLDTGADKDEALEKYRDSGLWWIEDKPENADLGHTIGLKSILVEHGHNMHHTCPYPIVKNWKEIFELITRLD
jgi:FMN phosphatase YigB (HAD superfamily)